MSKRHTLAKSVDGVSTLSCTTFSDWRELNWSWLALRLLLLACWTSENLHSFELNPWRIYLKDAAYSYSTYFIIMDTLARIRYKTESDRRCKKSERMNLKERNERAASTTLIKSRGISIDIDQPYCSSIQVVGLVRSGLRITSVAEAGKYRLLER